ncbi:MAG: acetylglutamate kinase [Duncaniella sp.]|nr:acetylglutamate kinase [Bacteroides sp.]MDE6036662.1 acetylglutamate kinase [Duncaniella sp.]MDE6065977.1 acetylglutamate kinase [Duncaniella sp.]
MSEQIKVIKIGGNIVDNPEALARFVSDFAAMPGRKILVHGGGKEATRLSSRLEIPTTMIEGRRVTSRETLDVVTMVYAGLVNKRIVSMLQAAGCNAIGLSGADGNAIRATRRPAAPIDYGYVGDIAPEGVNTHLLGSLLDAGFVPVFCAITHDGAGTLLNCNADTIASSVAIGASRLAPTDLIYCFEQPGVMEDIERSDSLIPLITPDTYASLRQSGVVNKGMIPKLDNSFRAIDAGVRSVIIKHAANLLTDVGTVLKN